LGLGLQLADYWLGYVLLLIPGLVRSSLIIFDRYYYDMVADPARYRYGGPRRLLEVLSRVAPHPDLTLLLDAPADVIVDRKGELTLHEAEHLRGSYLSVCARVKNVHRLDATQPAEAVLTEAKLIILDEMARRFHRRSPMWAPAGLERTR
jgi:thymidylate kinase